MQHILSSCEELSFPIEFSRNVLTINRILPSSHLIPTDNHSLNGNSFS